MASEPEQPERHVVILAVCVAAEGADQDDATRIAEAAVRKAVGDELRVSLPVIGESSSFARMVHVLHVGEVNSAANAGWLNVEPPAPCSFGAELMGLRHKDAGGPDVL